MILSAMRLVIIAGTATFLAGCVTRAPVANTGHAAPAVQSRTYAAPYDKVWGAVLTVLQDEQLTLSVVDKNSGMANGVKNITPSTMDMIMGYSVRTLVSVTSAQGDPAGVRISFSASMERKYKEAEWRPDTITDTSAYITQLYNKVDARLK